MNEAELFCWLVKRYFQVICHKYVRLRYSTGVMRAVQV